MELVKKAFVNLFHLMSWFIFADLIGNFLISSPTDPYGFGHWSIDPLWDILYLRVGGPFLYGNHEITALLIMGIPLYWCLKKGFGKISLWLGLAFSYVFIHEILVQLIVGYPVYGWAAIQPQIESVYMLGLGMIFLISLRFADTFQKKRLIWSAFLFVGIALVIMTVYLVTGYHPYTLARFAPGPDLYGFEANLFEDLGWLLPLPLWYVPDRWVSRLP